MSFSKISETQQNLFTILERGDRKIMKIKKRIIALVGLTRVGKSSVYNWILGRKMIGQGNPLQTNYVIQFKDQDAAAIKDGITSVTLIPNIIDLDEDTTLIDLAGYLDSRNHVGVLGVSYFLTSVFQKAEEIKFLIVFPENSFFDVNGIGWKNSLLGFINMFKLDLLTPEVRDKISSSVSLVCTRSNNPHQLQNYFRYVAQILKDSELIVQNKELLTQMVDRIIEENRIQAFKMARPNITAEPCNILKHFNMMNWQFLKLHEIEQSIGQKLINIPFQKDVKSLSQVQTIALTNVIENHINPLIEFTSILHLFMIFLKQNWLKAIKHHPQDQHPSNFMNQLFENTKIFDSIGQFLYKVDKYKSDQLIQTDSLALTYTRPTFVQIIKIILKIYQLTEKLGDNTMSCVHNLKEMGIIFSQLALCLKPLCINSQQERLILRILFIIKRVFHQLTVFFQIFTQRINYVCQSIKDCSFSNILSESHQKYLSDFIRSMNINILSKTITTIPQIQQYEEIYIAYKNKLIFSSCLEQMSAEVEFNDLNIAICVVKGNPIQKTNNKIVFIHSCINLLHQLIKKEKCLSKIESTKAFSQQKLNDVYFMKLKIIHKLIKILITMDKKQYPNVKDLAISLCEYSSYINLACQVYQLQLLDFPENTKKRCLILNRYAQYCIKWGRYSQAKILLQKNFELAFNMQERLETINMMYSLVEDQSRHLENEKLCLVKLQKQFLKDNQTLYYLLTEVKNAIQTQ